MPLDIGQQLGSYEITALLGRGGMGEVYRARDTKLKRDVAIKILPDEFLRDSNRITRFQREAEVLASLNHPNIAAIYDFQEDSDTRFLVLEVIEGETLAERIACGPLAIEDAIDIAKHICEALEAAHEKGIVHRDLKPANVKITPEGRVKVLDFGLAKALEDPQASGTLSNSPTLTLGGTQGGVVLGTASYMSPEQAKGLQANTRSDLFSFGAVLYEMLTGRQAFHGETVGDVLASVIAREPDLNALPPKLNPRLQELLQRCLEKNPKRRWQAVGDLRAELESVAAAPRSTPASTTIVKTQPVWRRAVPVLAALLLSVITAVLAWNLKPSAPASMVTRFPVMIPEDQTFLRTPSHLIAISPDGTKLAYSVSGQLFLREMSRMEARPIQGTAASDPVRPFFSPDGQWVGFYSFRDSALKKIPITGGAAITICKTNATTTARWNENDIVFYDPAKGILHVSADGGEPQLLVSVKAEEGSAYYPQVIDDGKAVLFTLTRFGGGDWDQAQIVVQSLASGERKVVVRGGSDGRYVPSGHVIYAVDGNVFALPFDLKTLQAKGGPVPVVEGIMRGTNQSGAAQLSFSDNGTLVYIPGDTNLALPRRTLAFADRAGKVDMLPLPPGAYETPRISPDGKQIAVTTSDGRNRQVAMYELPSGTTLRRLTFGGDNVYPVWSPDGKNIFFRSNRDGNSGIFQQPADGTGSAERLIIAENAGNRNPTSLDPTGKTLVFEANRRGDNDILMLAVEADRKPRPFVELPGSYQGAAVFSPDGRWVSYVSGESNRAEIYVQPYPVTGAKYQITADGGEGPVWSPDGKQLFYFWGTKLFAVNIRTQPTFSFGKPSPLPIAGLAQPPNQARNYDITPDGKRFIVVMQASQTEAGARSNFQINVVLNWFSELKQRVPVK